MVAGGRCSNQVSSCAEKPLRRKAVGVVAGCRACRCVERALPRGEGIDSWRLAVRGTEGREPFCMTFTCVILS